MMVAGVDGKTEEVVLFGCFLSGDECAEKGFGCCGCGVGDSDFAACGVIDGKDAEILNKRAAAPDVEDLDTKTDGEDGFVEVVCILKEEFVGVFARRVGRSAFGNGVLTVFLGVDISGAAREKNGLTGVDEVGNLNRSETKRNFYGCASTALDCRSILRPRALVIRAIGTGGLRDGDARSRRGVHHD